MVRLQGHLPCPTPLLEHLTREFSSLYQQAPLWRRKPYTPMYTPQLRHNLITTTTQLNHTTLLHTFLLHTYLFHTNLLHTVLHTYLLHTYLIHINLFPNTSPSQLTTNQSHYLYTKLNYLLSNIHN